MEGRTTDPLAHLLNSSISVQGKVSFLVNMDPEHLRNRLTTEHLEPLCLVLMKESLPLSLAGRLQSTLSRLHFATSLPAHPIIGSDIDVPVTDSLLTLHLSETLEAPVSDQLLARLRASARPLDCLATVTESLLSSLAPAQLLEFRLFGNPRLCHFFLLLQASATNLDDLLNKLAARCDGNSQAVAVFVNLVSWLVFQLSLPAGLNKLPPNFQAFQLLEYLSSKWTSTPRLLSLVARQLQRWQPLQRHLLTLLKHSVPDTSQSLLLGLTSANLAPPVSQPLEQPDILDLMQVDVATAAELIASDTFNHQHWASYLAELGIWLRQRDPTNRDRFLELLYRLRGHGVSLQLSPLPPDFFAFFAEYLPSPALELRLYDLPIYAPSPGPNRPFSNADFRLLVQQYLDAPLPDCGGLTSFVYLFGCLSNVPAAFDTAKTLLEDLRPLTAHLAGLLPAVLRADSASVRRALGLLCDTAAEITDILRDELLSEFDPAVANHAHLVCNFLRQYRSSALLASQSFLARLWFLSQGPSPLPDEWKRYCPSEPTLPDVPLLLNWILKAGADWSCWLLLSHPLAMQPTQLALAILTELFRCAAAPAWLPFLLQRLAPSHPLDISCLLPPPDHVPAALLDALLFLPVSLAPSALPSLPRSEELATSALLVASHAGLPLPHLAGLLCSFPFSVHRLSVLIRRTDNPDLRHRLKEELAQRQLVPLTPPPAPPSFTDTELIDSVPPSLLPSHASRSFSPLGLSLTQLSGSALALRLKLASPAESLPARRETAPSRPNLRPPTTPTSAESRKRFGTQPLAIHEIVKKLKTDVPHAEDDNNDVVLL